MTSPLWLLTVRRLQRLAESGITGFRQVLSQLFGCEARALVVVSQHLAHGADAMARHSLKLGEDGKHLFHRLRRPGQERPEAMADEADDAPFDDESEAAAETPKRIGPRARR
jgi:hypothetical protein